MSGNSIEYTMVCIDNSDFMRNEDIRPNRFFAEKDSTNIICHHILTARPENRVGLVTTAGEPQVIQSLTDNEINFMRKLYGIEMKGEIKLSVSLQICVLSLKQIPLKGLVTQNKRQRIIVFVGSPFKEDAKEFDRLVPKLNKHKISVDIICFGPENQKTSQLLESFVRKLKNSHFVFVPNNRVMTNVLVESPILSDSRTVSLVNENMDPELALAMKMSMNDHKSKSDEDMKKAMDESIEASSSFSTNSDQLKKTSQFKSKGKSSPTGPSVSDEDLQKAIEMSLMLMKEAKEGNASIPELKSQKTSPPSKNDSKRMTEEEQLALSLQMSLLSQKHSKDSSNQKKEPEGHPKGSNTKTNDKNNNHSKNS